MAPSDRPEPPDTPEPERKFEPYISIGGHSDFRQLDLLGPPPEPNYDPDPEEVRAELLALLAKAKAAPDVPWDSREASLYRVVFPQMANWLPDEEAARLRSEFRAELERLGIG